MFQRVHFEDGVSTIGIVAFAITACVFVYYVWKATRMGREKADYMSRRPLEDDSSNESSDS